MASEHEWRDCFHPTTQQGGDGCHFVMRCHGIWPERCDLSERDHRESDAEKIERLTALLAERDAEVARLREAAQAYIDAYDAALKAPLQYAQAEEYCHAQRYNLRAALAARGGEVQG